MVANVLHTFTGMPATGSQKRDWLLTTVWALSMDAVAAGLVFMVRWWMALSRSRSLPPGALERAAAPGLTHSAIGFITIGFITNFFDTLGIGSFVTTTTRQSRSAR